jgi:hypothetical protein
LVFLLILLSKNFVQIPFGLAPFLLIHDFLYGVKMIILENVTLELIQSLITERTAMMSIYRLFDAGSAVDMSTSCHVTVLNGVQAHCALELSLKFASVDFEGVA